MGDTIWDWSTTAADNATADTSIDWSEGQLPSTVNNSAREMMAKIAYMLRDFSSSLTTGGTGDAYTVSPGKEPTSLADGWIAVVRFDRANTGPATFQIGTTLAAADLVDAEGNALAAGDIVAGGIYIVSYNPTSASFHLVNRVPLHAGDVGTTQIADLAVTTAKLADAAVTTAKIADANVTPAKLDSTGAYTVDSLTATTTLLRGTSIIWGDDNFASRIAALTENTSPAGAESVACDDGQRVLLSTIRGPDFISGALVPPTAAWSYVTVSHGLGYTPRFMTGFLVNIVSEIGYVPGDVVSFSAGHAYYGANLFFADSTTVGYVNNGHTMQLVAKDGSTYAAPITDTSWEFYIAAWK